MKILIPPSEGKAKIKPQEIKFQDTDFIFERSVRQVVRQLNLIDNEDLLSGKLKGLKKPKKEVESRVDR
mgnify:CR=1 FL=1